MKGWVLLPTGLEGSLAPLQPLVPGPGFPIVTINLKSPLPMNKLWEQKCQGQQGLLIVIAPYGVTESSQH